MDARDLADLGEVLFRAVIEANALPRETGIDTGFRMTVRRTRELQIAFATALNENTHLSAHRLRVLSEAANAVICELEALAAMPDGPMPKPPQPDDEL